MNGLSRCIALFFSTTLPFLFALLPGVSLGIDLSYPKAAVPGGIYPVTVSGRDIVSVTGTFGGGRVYLNPAGPPCVFSGIIGVHITAPAGERPIVIVAVTRGGRVLSTIVPVTVGEASFPTESLTVDEKFVDFDDATKERIASENREMKVVIRDETPRRLWSEPFIVPCAGPISGEFGLTRYFNGKPSRPHAGIDISANTGEIVRAANDGIVALIQDSYLGGTILVIDHGQGLYTMYCHLSGVLVTTGDAVSRGKPVALVGATGRVTGAHLHFGVFLNHHSVNPQDLFGRRFP